MAISSTSRLVTGLLGPTREELLELLELAAPGTRVHVDRDAGYNQMDPGSLTFSVTTKPMKPATSPGVTEWRDR